MHTGLGVTLTDPGGGDVQEYVQEGVGCFPQSSAILFIYQCTFDGEVEISEGLVSHHLVINMKWTVIELW